ncbi:MAG: hypothetical protein AAB778_01255 [Patescibacteria group bacterium]
MIKNLAQINLYDGGQYKGFGTLGLEQGQEGVVVFQTFISSAIGLISVIAIIWFVFIIASSGIAYMSAGADQKAAEGARKRITNGLVGLLVTIFGIFILVLVGEIFNIDGILNLKYLFENISIK